jgi:hypothetical protein
MHIVRGLERPQTAADVIEQLLGGLVGHQDRIAAGPIAVRRALGIGDQAQMRIVGVGAIRESSRSSRIKSVAKVWTSRLMPSNLPLAELIISPSTSDVITTKILAISRTTFRVSSCRCWAGSFR